MSGAEKPPRMYYLNFLLLCALVCFLYGFFPLSLTPTAFPNHPPNRIGNLTTTPEHLYKPHFNKTILIVIDALRWDFVTPQLMPLTTNLMTQKGCLSKVLVESPTVTLPRIKAMTTGSVPQYVDVVRNLAASEVLQDSWLHSAKKRGLKLVFYGDNTWEKLFPGLFVRSEGTTSFFVWDFNEVDYNVTRNVDMELKEFDWDIMVLHYLGLDHIGHVLGPFSDKMPLKLQEMDQVVHKIVTETSSKFDVLVLVTGDHGMRDAGGHGGTSQAEVQVPLVALGLDCDNSTFLQTDIPVNLAVLLGLNIPSSSIGNLQPALLKSLNMSEYLYALRYNTETLIKKSDLKECANDFEQATVLHLEYLLSGAGATEVMQLYKNCSQLITTHLYESTTKQNIPLMVISLFFMGFTVFTLGLTVCQEFVYIFNASTIFVLISSLIQPLTFLSTSFIEEEHYFWMYTCITLITIKALEGHQRQDYKSVIWFNYPVNLNLVSNLLIMCVMRFSIDLNSTVENSVQNDNNWAHILSSDDMYIKVFFILGLLATFFTLNSSNLLTPITLILILVLKSLPYHSAVVGKLLWILIGAQLFFSSQTAWVLSSVLLIKPHNVVLVPFGLHVACSLLPSFKSGFGKATVSHMISLAFYFMQGHRNSLASVDVSIGYTGLNSYQPVIVIAQVLMHTYTFPVLFHFIALKGQKDVTVRHYWLTLLGLRAWTLLLTCIVTVLFKYHLFVWSVFAPKLLIETVHTFVLFTEITLWFLTSYR